MIKFLILFFYICISGVGVFVFTTKSAAQDSYIFDTSEYIASSTSGGNTNNTNPAQFVLDARNVEWIFNISILFYDNVSSLTVLEISDSYNGAAIASTTFQSDNSKTNDWFVYDFCRVDVRGLDFVHFKLTNPSATNHQLRALTGIGPLEIEFNNQNFAVMSFLNPTINSNFIPLAIIEGAPAATVDREESETGESAPGDPVDIQGDEWVLNWLDIGSIVGKDTSGEYKIYRAPGLYVLFFQFIILNIFLVIFIIFKGRSK